MKRPFDKCDKEYTILNSFTGHLSKIHQNIHRNYNAEPPERESSNVEQNQKGLINDKHDKPDLVQFTAKLNSKAYAVNIGPVSNLSLLNAAQLYSKLEWHLLVPASTIQKILAGTLNIHEQGQERIVKDLKKRLLEENLPTDQVIEMVNDVFDEDPFVKSAHIHINHGLQTKKMLQEALRLRRTHRIIVRK